MIDEKALNIAWWVAQGDEHCSPSKTAFACTYEDLESAIEAYLAAAPPALLRNDLRQANVARDVEWNVGKEKVSATFRAVELAGEVGEACNVVKKLERERIGVVGSLDTAEHLAQELADVVICADLLAMEYQIDLQAAIVSKFNATSEKNGLKTRMGAAAPYGGQKND